MWHRKKRARALHCFRKVSKSARVPGDNSSSGVGFRTFGVFAGPVAGVLAPEAVGSSRFGISGDGELSEIVKLSKIVESDM